MRTEWVKPDEMDCILMAMHWHNALALRVSLATGLRISDVLSLRSDCLHLERISLRERKTGKRRTVRLPQSLKIDLARIAGKVFIFEGRLSPLKARTRQAVYKDMRSAAKALHLSGAIAPHSCRKAYAVRKYHASGDIRAVQRLLNHDSEAVTILYALADELTARGKHRHKPQSAAGGAIS